MCVRSGCEDVAECVEGCCGVRADMVRSLCVGRAKPFGRGVNADLLVSIKFANVQTGGSKGVSRLIVALSHKDYPCVSI